MAGGRGVEAKRIPLLARFWGLSVLQSARGAAWIALLFIVMLSACAGPNVGTKVPRGVAAYDVIPAPIGKPSVAEYRIGPLDTMNVSVYQEADLSQPGLIVDASGNVDVPLIGRVLAAGQTTAEFARELERRWSRYYVKPQVTVTVTSSVSQRVTVQGQVTTPGIYAIKGPTTLLDAISLAQGETQVAALKETVVFRVVNGQRMVAVFDIARIRRGDDPDPSILGNDTVIVGYSNTKGLWRDILQTAPLLNVFRSWR